jgi:hypothetical protein
MVLAKYNLPIWAREMGSYLQLPNNNAKSNRTHMVPKSGQIWFPPTFEEGSWLCLEPLESAFGSCFGLLRLWLPGAKVARIRPHDRARFCSGYRPASLSACRRQPSIVAARVPVCVKPGRPLAINYY